MKKIIIIIGFLMFALGTPIFANDVRITQQLLTKLGYNPGPIDGSYGDKTKRALENFYAAQNKKFDGELSSNEINALETVFAKKNNSLNKPPFEGTAYVDKDIIQKNDPSDFISLEYVGLVKEKSFDRRVDTLVSQDMFVFNVKYKNKKGTRVIVNT
jgi:peptidoglycan hydrolase-like protein with peptidoglycan-binding domain